MAQWRELLPGGYGVCQKQKVVSQRTMKKRSVEIREEKKKVKQNQMVFSRTPAGTTQMITKSNNSEDEEAWGDKLEMREDNVVRIVSKQIGGLGVVAGNSKERELKNWMVANEVDCIGIQETNVFWKKCRDKAQFRERMRHHEWDFVRTATSYNKHEFTALNQFGGTAVVATNTLASRVLGTGGDEAGLGRWAWTRFRGKNKTFSRVISAYQPHKGSDKLHPKAVYRQQQRYWLDQNSDQCPLHHFRDDLCSLLQKWIQSGERIVLLIDANEKISTGTLHQRLERLGLVSVYKHRFGLEQMPATYHRGSEPIDNIFVTQNFRTLRAGMFAFGDGPGDHRGLYVDIDIESFMGAEEYIVQRLQARRLISTNPLVTEKFNRLFNEQLQRNHIHEQIDELYSTFTVPMTDAYIAKYEKIDRIQVSAFQYANKRCRKLRCGDVPSSDTLNHFGCHIKLWTNVIRKKLGCKVSSKYIRRIANECGIDDPMSVSIELAREWRAQAWRDYDNAKEDAPALRDAYIDRMYEKISEEEGMKKADVVLQKKQREDTRNAHRKIKFARNKLNSGGTMKLEISDTNKKGTIEVTDKVEMEKILMDTNEKKFRLACNTPFVQGQLLKDLGPCGMTRKAESVLLGTYEPPENCNQGAKKFITAVKMSEAIKSAPPISAAITPAQHTKFWRSQRESTQSSPSGLHFGFMKTTAKVPRLASTISKLVSIPYESGYSPDRWRNSINVTLMKEEGEYRPEKQRTIHLLESTFSEGTKIIFSRRMMQHARKYGQLPPDQYARKGGKAIDAAIQKILIYDIMRMQRRPGICFANDLMACYDRMAHVPSGLALRFLGAPPTAVQCMSTTIQNMRHYIRTAYGDSDNFYGGDPTRPLQGGGQGSPAAPPMWIALTIIVLNMLTSYEPGVTVVFAISATILTFSAILYVDDTDLFTLKKDDETVPEMLTRAQTLTSRWVEAMWATGAALRPEKCWWCLVDFTWKGSKWRYNFYDDNDVSLLVRDDDGLYQKVQRVDVYEGKKGLGLRFAANGCMDAELEYLKKASVKWAADIHNSYLDRKTSALALTTTISGTWAYPSPATNFTRKQAETLMKPVFKSILPKMGVNRHLPKAYRYAPLSHHGLAAPDYFTNQGVDHIITLVSHMVKNTYVGDLIEATLEIAALEIGMGENIFHLPYDVYSPLLTESWIKVPWQCCWENDIVLHGEYRLPQLARVQDRYLMDMVVHSKLLTNREKLIVNRCRLFLQVLTLADISTGDGTKVAHSYYTGVGEDSRSSRYSWPEQGQPSRAEWKIWIKCVDMIWAPEPRQTFTRPLGAWTNTSHHLWRWFHFDGCLYYRCSKNKYQCFRNSFIASRRSHCRLFFETNEYVTSIPTESERATVQAYSNICIRFEGSAPMHISKLDSTLDKEMKNIQRLLQGGRWLDDGQSLVAAILASKARCVADGSFHPQYEIGTTAYVFDDGRDNIIGMGGHRVPGPKSSQCSYRSELFGIYLSLLIIQQVCQKHNIQSGGITIGCDNISALDKSLAEQFFPSIQHKHFEMLWAIHSIREEIPVLIEFRHVKGHQDDDQNQLPLDRWAQLNILADREAKKHLAWYIQNPSHDTDLQPVSPHWTIHIDNSLVTANVRHTLQDHIHSKNMKEFLCRKGEIEPIIYDCIDWEANGRAMKTLKFSERIWVTKHVSGFCGSAKMMERCKKWESALCPRCGDVIEDNWHIMWCKEISAVSNRQQLTTKVDTWLRDNNSHPALHRLIIMMLQQGDCINFSTCARGNLDKQISALAYEQDIIGVRNFFHGRLSKQWSVLQEQYLRLNVPRSRRSGSSWTSGLLRQIYRWGHAQWLDRNDVVHKKETADAEVKLMSDVDRKIVKEFSVGINGVRAQDQYVFLDLTLNEVLDRKLLDKENWLRHVTAVRKRALQVEVTQMDRMRTFMERWKKRKK